MRSLRNDRPDRSAQAAGLASRPQRASQPNGSRLARPRSRRRALGVAGRALVIASIAAASALAFKFGVPIASAARIADALAVKMGLGIDQVTVAGFRNTLTDDIFAALRIEHPGSLLAYDAVAARNRLEALPYVASAQVIRTLPDGLDVMIRERQPFAVWQHKQLMFLIDADGRELEPTARGDHPELPLVVGDDAETGAKDLMDMLRRFPMIASRLQAAVRVGGRRWDLQLKDAARLMLPEDGPADALAWAERMEREERLFDRRLAAIDLRVAGRVAFVPSDQPSASPDHPAARPPTNLNRGA